MAKPYLLTVDDEPHVLNAIERDLRRRFGREYQIVKARSGAEALETVQQLKQRNAALALLLCDQRMPGMSGTEFLLQAIPLYPQARKVLLTAYADTEAAIQSINEVGLDHYILKPWDPPEDRLYPVLEALLADWKATVEQPYEGIRLAGTLWSPQSHLLKDFLSRNQVPYQWLDVEADAEAEALVAAACGEEGVRLPVLFFPDGTALVQPEQAALAEKIGMHARASQPFYDLAIIGAGPAGLGAAVYGGSEGLRTVLIEKHATGGQAGSSSKIENYLGFPSGLSGADLASRATIQARRFGVEILLPRAAVAVRVEQPYKIVELSDGTEIRCHALVLATGVTNRRLEAPGIDELTGAGVYYGATLSEAAHYRDEEVYLVGGANSAGQAALHFARYARRVVMVVRGSALAMGMSHYLVEQIESTPNIEVLVRTTVVAAHGERRLEGLTLEDGASGEQREAPAAALFLFIGAVPHTEMVAGLVLRNRTGFILTGPDVMAAPEFGKVWPLKRNPYLLETSVPGIFAAGDNRHSSVKRVASAVGEGGVVIALAHQYLRSV
jgi:thioredoxin reductase (NADPH)